MCPDHLSPILGRRDNPHHPCRETVWPPHLHTTHPPTPYPPTHTYTHTHKLDLLKMKDNIVTPPLSSLKLAIFEGRSYFLIDDKDHNFHYLSIIGTQHLMWQQILEKCTNQRINKAMNEWMNCIYANELSAISQKISFC